MAWDDQAVMEATLAIVNDTREACGLKKLDALPPGMKRNMLMCPLANALPDDAMVTPGEVRFADRESARALAGALNRRVLEEPTGANFAPRTKGKSEAKKRPWVVKIAATPLRSFVYRFDESRKPNRTIFSALIRGRRADVKKV